jgi:catechol 2,3-dioxygenase-like lactoylglutathione lyase family enzyme
LGEDRVITIRANADARSSKGGDRMNKNFSLGLMILLFGAALPIVAQGGGIKAQTTPDFEAQGAFLGLVVTDLDASRHWYESNLGLRFVKRSKSPRAEIIVLKGRNIFIELIHIETSSAAKLAEDNKETHAPGLFKAGVILGNKDFESLAGYMRNRGVEFIGGVFEDKEMRVRTFLVKDNGGNRIQFFTKIK